MDYPTLDVGRLIQGRDIFYGRLCGPEVSRVQETIGTITDYMRYLDRGSFLIAGVGSVLRLENPEKAKDIDLAVVGLNYTSLPARERRHTFEDVIDFTQVVRGYFGALKSRLGEGRTEHIPLGKGSGPFAGWDEGFRSLETGVEARTSLDFFGWYNSKGLQVIYEGVRPIDIQFVFNEDPDEWRGEQECLGESPGGPGGKADRFFYSVLHEQH